MGIFSLPRRSLDALLPVLFPTACPLCQKEVSRPRGLGVCAACWRGVTRYEGAICSSCGLPVVAAAEVENLCGPCRRGSYRFDCARSYGLYAFPLRDLILHLKFRRRERWGRLLGELLADLAQEQEWNRDERLIVPVPLHPARQRERGYNQAALLAAGLYRRLKKLRCADGLSLSARALVRARATAPQSGLAHHARQENVRGVFAAPHPEWVRGRRILLIDDVMTTGATVSACAAVLKRAGASDVAVLTLARSTPQFPDFASL
ncbi:MAG: double zinc ribbon domain-containing protein [Terriglobia bacterium]